MLPTHLHPGWPTRLVDVTIDGLTLTLRTPESPYAMLDLPAVERDFAEDEYMPYWGYLWPASPMLARWLKGRVESPGRPDDEPAPPPPPARVLEIGCGLGLAGLFAARLGYQVTLADYDGDAVEFVKQSARLNQLPVAVAQLDWRQDPLDRYPLILAADVLYEQRTHSPIREFLRLALAPGGLAVLSDPLRHVADAFVHDAPAAGWRVHVSPAHWDDRPGRIICLRRDASL